MMQQPSPVDTHDPDHDAPDFAASALDERRLTMRAYLYWQSLLRGRLFPSVADLDPQAVASFSDQSILLDFTQGPEAPILRFVGRALREEGGIEQGALSPVDVPTRSLISRLTAHYMEIHANLSPVGFEAEFESPRDVMTKYRGILLPLSDDGQTINFMYGVVSWKDEALLEDTTDAQGHFAATPSHNAAFEDDALELTGAMEEDILDLATPVEELPLDDDDIDALLLSMPVTEPDGPAQPETVNADLADALTLDTVAPDAPDQTTLPDIEDLLSAASAHTASGPEPVIGGAPQDDALTLEWPGDAVIDEPAAAPDEDLLELSEPLVLESQAAEGEDAPLDLADWSQVPESRAQDAEGDDSAVEELFGKLELAQLKAAASRSSDHRSRTALYQALAEAHDFGLAATAAPQAYERLLETAGLKQQQRAPFTPITKLVFGEDYDKTRLTEFAASLSYAHREGVRAGSFHDFIENFPGGLKGMVQAERAARAQAMGNRRTDSIEGMRDTLRRLPAIATIEGASIPDQEEFALVLVRRRPMENTVEVIGSVPGSSRMAEAAARRLAAQARNTRSDKQK